MSIPENPSIAAAAEEPDTPQGTEVLVLVAHEEARRLHEADLLLTNKAAVFAALLAGGIDRVVVLFDGAGDSGQIESLDSYSHDEPAQLPNVEVEIIRPIWGASEVERRSVPVGEAIEQLAYDLLSKTHGGWENNDGAFGEFVFAVTTDTITLEHNERFTDVETLNTPGEGVMGHCYHHALSSVKKWGGEPDDYLPLHQWFDESKAITADFRHRALRHHAEGVFMLERFFGPTITLSTGRVVPVRLIGEQHIVEDLGFIPSFADWVRCIRPEPWMGRAQPIHKLVDPFAARSGAARTKRRSDRS